MFLWKYETPIPPNRKRKLSIRAELTADSSSPPTTKRQSSRISNDTGHPISYSVDLPSPKKSHTAIYSEGKAGFPHKLRHTHSLQSIGTCVMKLTVDVATFGVLAAIRWAGVVAAWRDCVCRGDVEELSHHGGAGVFAPAAHLQRVRCWPAVR